MNYTRLAAIALGFPLALGGLAVVGGLGLEAESRDRQRQKDAHELRGLAWEISDTNRNNIYEESEIIELASRLGVKPEEKVIVRELGSLIDGAPISSVRDYVTSDIALKAGMYIHGIPE